MNIFTIERRHTGYFYIVLFYPQFIILPRASNEFFEARIGKLEFHVVRGAGVEPALQSSKHCVLPIRRSPNITIHAALNIFIILLLPLNISRGVKLLS